MAVGTGMTIEEVVRRVLREEHGDVIREPVRAVCQEVMEAEVSELIGAPRGERTGERATHRNGYRPRRWDTRAGEIQLIEANDCHEGRPDRARSVLRAEDSALSRATASTRGGARGVSRHRLGNTPRGMVRADRGR